MGFPRRADFVEGLTLRADVLKVLDTQAPTAANEGRNASGGQISSICRQVIKHSAPRAVMCSAHHTQAF